MKISKILSTIEIFVCFMIILASATVVYPTLRLLTPGDIEPIVRSLDEVVKLLREDDQGASVLRSLEERDKQLQIALTKLTNQTGSAEQFQQTLTKHLQAIASDLMVLRIGLTTETVKSAAALMELSSQIELLLKRYGQPTPQQESASSSWVGYARELSSLLSWPLAVLVLLWYLTRSRNAPRRVAELFKPFRSFKLLGTEFVLNEEVAKNAEEAFEVYRKQAKREYDRRIEVYALRQKLEEMVQFDVTSVLGSIQDIPDFRCTLHVPDILFAETLYQLLDYYPRGGGRGRTWSVRFGIIGRAWRLGKSQTQGHIPTTAQDLILEWGMTKEEAAAAGQGRQSFTCCRLAN